MGMSDGEWEPAIVDKWFPCADPGKCWPFYQQHLASADDLYWWEGNDEFSEGWYCSTCYQVTDEYKEISRDAPLPNIGGPPTEERLAYLKKIDEFFNSKRRFIDEIAELDEKGLDNLTQEVEIWRSPLHKYLDD